MLNFVKKTTAAFSDTQQQKAIFDWVVNGTGSATITAVAGAGKTTTLCKAVRLMEGTVFFGAFSKMIADELSAKIGHLGIADISTMHAFGMRQWKKVAGKFVKVDSNKCLEIFREITFQDIDYSLMERPVLQLVSLAKQAGLGIQDSFEDCGDRHNSNDWSLLIDHFGVEVFDEQRNKDNRADIIMLAKRVYEDSLNLCKKIIDFDDMILAPLFFGVSIDKYDWVLIDEAQDTNVVRRLLARRMMKETSRLLAVGDPRQAIFGFTGADAKALDLISKMSYATELPLTFSFRCPKAVVAYAQQWVKHIQSTEDAAEGRVYNMPDVSTVAVGDAILCRFNAPLLGHAYQLISMGIPARIEGKDVANGLKSLIMRWKVPTFDKLSERLEAYVEREEAKLKEKENLRGLENLMDKVGCIRVIIERVKRIGKSGNPVSLVVEEITNLFGDSSDPKEAQRPHVRLSSIHKSKGLEWDKVFWIITGPSPYARKPWELEQEDNLCYVAATRAKKELILVGSGKKE